VQAEGGAFQVAVALQRGINHVRVVALDAYGVETEDAVTLQYEPPVADNGIVVTSPRDGLLLTPDDPPVVVVEGEVEDKSVSTVLLTANQLRVSVPVRAGRFRWVLPVFEPQVRLRVEASVNGTVHQSSTVTVHSTAGSGAQFGVIVFDWPEGTPGPEVEVSAIWRATPERVDVPTQTMVMKTLASVDGAPADAFYLRIFKPGVYAFVLRSRGAAATEGVRSTLYVPAAGATARRDLEPFSLNGAERRLIARVLLPQGVFWEQDEWFSGRSESIDTVTKFRFPEGITWVERKADRP